MFYGSFVMGFGPVAFVSANSVVSAFFSMLSWGPGLIILHFHQFGRFSLSSFGFSRLPSL